MASIFRYLRRGFGENVRFALLAVRTHKLRAFLTVLGIVVGVATVIAMVSIVTGFNNNMVRNFQSFGATLVQFQKYEARFGPGHRDESERRRKDLHYEDAVALKESIPEMRAVSPERYLWNTDISVKYRDNETTTPVVAGVAPDYSIANNHYIGYGRFITESDFQHTAFRLEVLQRYTVPYEKEPLRRFLANEPPPDDPDKERWLAFIREAVGAGKRMQRVHVVVERKPIRTRRRNDAGNTSGEALHESKPRRRVRGRHRHPGPPGVCGPGTGRRCGRRPAAWAAGPHRGGGRSGRWPAWCRCRAWRA